jgi:hypothetical protein
MTTLAAYAGGRPVTPSNEILQAIEAMKDLKNVVAKHDEVIDRLITRIEQLEARLKAVKGGPAGHTVTDRPGSPWPDGVH